LSSVLVDVSSSSACDLRLETLDFICHLCSHPTPSPDTLLVISGLNLKIPDFRVIRSVIKLPVGTTPACDLQLAPKISGLLVSSVDSSDSLS